jgi:outer membrane protein OmpA-like peptidoglycan-associated protein
VRLNSLLQYVIEVTHPEYEDFRIIYYHNGDGSDLNFPLNPKQTEQIKEVEPIPTIEKIEIKKGTTLVFNNIFYDYNSAVLRPDAIKELDQIFKILIDNPSVKIQLSAHTDSRGDDNYNMRLSEQRAQSAKTYLVNKGIKSTRIVAKGFGESKIRNHCKNNVECSEEEHKFNRRTEVEILEK